MIVEAQPWKSYQNAIKKQDMSMAPYRDLTKLQFRPPQFTAFLQGLGLELITSAKGDHCMQGFARDILFFTKRAAAA